jgi:hypothetical protein
MMTENSSNSNTCYLPQHFNRNSQNKTGETQSLPSDLAFLEQISKDATPDLDISGLRETHASLTQALSAVKSCRSLPAQRLVSVVIEKAIADCDMILKSDRGMK